MDPVSVAALSWLTSQAAAAGERRLRRLVFGDRQQNALRKVAEASIKTAVETIVPVDDQPVVLEALLREDPDRSDIDVADSTDLRSAIRYRLSPRLTVLAEQGFEFDNERLYEIISQQIQSGITADSLHGGTLTPIAQFLILERLTAVNVEAVEQLRQANLGLDQISILLRQHRADVYSLFDQLDIARPGEDKHESVRRTGFTGRDWLLAQVDEFIVNHRRGYVLIEGEAGVGKSAFALWLAFTRGYACHFTRLPGGREILTAVKNLAAQLIDISGIDDLAPGGTFPPEASQPYWLQQVITTTAAKNQALQQDAPLVLVVDGLDEADPSSGPPLALPPKLPDGVFIVATFRTGTPLRWLREEYITCSLGASSPANLADMRQYLQSVCLESQIAKILDRANVTSEQFIEKILERSAGMWIYLHYVLQELRSNRRSPVDIDQLPHGLWGYYTENVAALRERLKDWDDFYLPLLATLAAAQEPLTPATLATLAELPGKESDIRRFVGQSWRPFCQSVDNDRFAIYHQSLRDYLSGSPGLNYMSWPEFTQADRAELSQAAFDAHQRISQRYLAAWGGLDDGLPILTGDDNAAALDEGYGLRHLPAHMEICASDNVHRLLSCQQLVGTSPRTRNVWYFVHDRAGTPDIYLAHLSRAVTIARKTTDSARSEGLIAPTIGLEVRYSLITTSITGLAASLSAEMISALLMKQVWQWPQALTHIRNNPDAATRARAYISVIDQVPDVERPVILVAALDAVRAIRREKTRARALAALAPILNKPLLAVALTAVWSIQDGHAQISALGAIIPHLPEDERATAIAAGMDRIRSIADHAVKVQALSTLLPYLPKSQQPAVLAEAAAIADQIGDQSTRVVALATILPFTPEDEWEQKCTSALTVSQTIDNDRGIALTLAALAPFLNSQLLTAAAEMAEAINNDQSRAEALVALAPFMNPDLLATALRSIERIDNWAIKGQALATLVSLLHGEEQSRVMTDVLETARTFRGDRPRASVLVELAPHLTPPFVTIALELARDIRYPPARARVLAALAPRLPAALLPAALEAAQSVGGRKAEVVALAALASQVAETQENAFLSTALNIARNIRYQPSRMEALCVLAPHLGVELLDIALEAAQTIQNRYARVITLAAIGPRLPVAQRSIIAEAALAITRTIRNQPARVEALTMLAPILAPTLIGEALEIAKKVPHRPFRARALVALVPYLTPRLLKDALDAAKQIDLEPVQITVLAAIAPRLPESDRPIILDEALNAARFIGQPARAKALAKWSRP